jgi:L-methionine (R)-S-oxide reductase
MVHGAFYYKPMTESPLNRLYDLAALVTAHVGLNQHLAELARLTAQATHATSCSIYLHSEKEGGTPSLKLFASTESTVIVHGDAPVDSGMDEELALQVLAQRKPMFLAGAHCQQGSRHHDEHTAAKQGRSLIGVPITVDDCAIGVMTLGQAHDTATFEGAHVTVAAIAAALIGKAIQVERIQTLLRSRIAQLTLVRQQGDVAERLTAGTLPPSRLAKLLARSFYKDLSAAGFEPGQIIEAASEIITQITADISRFEKRLARKSKEPEN